MRYWLDTEYIERPYTIDLISIGLVAEDGREFYAESSEVDWSQASRWTLETVRPQLQGLAKPREQIGYAIRRFTGDDERPLFWGYFPAYALADARWTREAWAFLAALDPQAESLPGPPRKKSTRLRGNVQDCTDGPVGAGRIGSNNK